MAEIPTTTITRCRSWSVPNFNALFPGKGANQNCPLSPAFRIENGHAEGSLNISKYKEQDKGHGLCISNQSKPAPTPLKIGFVITHSTVDVPSKSAYRPASRKQCEDDESESEEMCECFYSEMDNYEDYVDKFEGDDEMSNNNDWCCDSCDCHDFQPDDSGVKIFDSHNWDEEKDWGCDSEFWETVDHFDFDNDCDNWFDSHGDDYECWECGCDWDETWDSEDEPH